MVAMNNQVLANCTLDTLYKNYSKLAIRRLRRLLARPTGGSLASLGKPPPPLASLANPPRRSLRSPPPPPPPLGHSWRSDPGLWPQIASDELDVGFAVTPSHGPGGQIEVASSNDLGGRGLERPLMSWPRATSEVAASNDLKWVLEV